ncbi:MAG: OPT/YSL family transporter, partial [Planctomycetota bacterium]
MPTDQFSPIDPSQPQFTLRAVLTGMVLAAVLSVCNVYIGLKMGIGLNMSIVAILLGYAFWTLARRASGGEIRPWGILENNINQTACSSGALVASAGLVAPIPALTLLTGITFSWHCLALWVFAVCLVGILVAVALRRHMVIEQKLPFPVGTASAEMLRELHSRGREALLR